MVMAIVLGAGAGGGFPQWNSAAPACLRARTADQAAPVRTQCSLAISADCDRWVLLNASPDMRAQIEATPALHPRAAHGPRHSPVAAVVLAGGEVDAIAGLLTLREGHRFMLHAPPTVLTVLAANPIFDVLRPDLVARLPLPPNRPVALHDADGRPLGLTVESFAVPGKPPLFMEQGADPGAQDDATVGLRVRAQGATHGGLAFVPGCAHITDAVLHAIEGADCLCFDGTLWQDDELLQAGVGSKTGRRMGHVSLDGAHGTLARLRHVAVRRRVLVHMNNTNPVLLADSPEAATVRNAGWEIGYDGMEIEL